MLRLSHLALSDWPETLLCLNLAALTYQHLKTLTVVVKQAPVPRGIRRNPSLAKEFKVSLYFLLTPDPLGS